MTPLGVLLVIFSHLSVRITAVAYTITKQNQEIVHYNQETIESEPGAKIITVQEQFHFFDKDLLSVQHKTAVFQMTRNYALGRLEKGAFQDQQLTEAVIIANSQVKEILKGVFKNMKIFQLILNHNRIEKIEDGAFDDLPNLELVRLSYNALKQINPGAFVKVPVRVMDLSFNRLDAIQKSAFGFMSDKVTLKLDNNEITSIQPDAFNGTTLESLNLKSNKLKELPKEIFHGNSLMRIFLQDNQLKDLPGTFFNQTNLREAVLSGYKFDCDTEKKLKVLEKRTKGRIIYNHNC